MDEDLLKALRDGGGVKAPALAKALGLSRVGIYEAVKRGEIPAIRIGRRIIIPAHVARRLLGLDMEAA
jgi:excisionase family DNA binding protein